MIVRAARVIGIILFFLCALSFGQTKPAPTACARE